MNNTTLMPRTRTWEKFGLVPTYPSLQGTGLPFVGAGSAHSTFGDVVPAIDNARTAQVPPRDRPV